jgi:hypothetical protein
MLNLDRKDKERERKREKKFFLEKKKLTDKLEFFKVPRHGKQTSFGSSCAWN